MGCGSSTEVTATVPIKPTEAGRDILDNQGATKEAAAKATSPLRDAAITKGPLAPDTRLQSGPAAARKTDPLVALDARLRHLSKTAFFGTLGAHMRAFTPPSAPGSLTAAAALGDLWALRVALLGTESGADCAVLRQRASGAAVTSPAQPSLQDVVFAVWWRGRGAPSPSCPPLLAVTCGGAGVDGMDAQPAAPSRFVDVDAYRTACWAALDVPSSQGEAFARHIVAAVDAIVDTVAVDSDDHGLRGPSAAGDLRAACRALAAPAADSALAALTRAALAFARDGSSAGGAANPLAHSPSAGVGQAEAQFDASGNLPESVVGALRLMTPNAAVAIAVIARAVDCALEVLAVLSGGRRAQRTSSPAAAVAPCWPAPSAALSRILGRVRRYCADPALGMEATSKVESELEGVASLLCLIGVVPPLVPPAVDVIGTDPSATAVDLSDIGAWLPHMPLELLDAPAAGFMAYLALLLRRQHRLNVRHVRRHAVLQDALGALAAAPRGSGLSSIASFKVFPVFDGEAGEGHGPRKEFFDCCAGALFAAHAAPYPVPPGSIAVTPHSSNSITVAAMSGSEAGAIAAALMRTGAKLVLGGAANSGPFDATVVDVQSRGGELVVRVDREVGAGHTILSIAAPQRPPFAVPYGRAAAWLNDSMPDALPTSWVRGADVLTAGFDTIKAVDVASAGTPEATASSCFTAGWLLGTAVANGVPLSRLPLPVVFFKFLRLATLRLLALRDADVPQNQIEARLTALIHETDVTESDALELDPSLADTFTRMRSLPSVADVAAFAEAAFDVADDPVAAALVARVRASASVRAAADTLITGHFAYRTLYLDARWKWLAVTRGFIYSTLPFAGGAACTSPSHLQAAVEVPAEGTSDAAPAVAHGVVFERLTPATLRAICLGAAATPDDGTSGFVWAEHFDVVFDSEFVRQRHSFAFRRIIQDTLFTTPASAAAAAEQRALLRFITGRSFLPAFPRGDAPITVAFATSCSTIGELLAAGRRLPSAHACTNTVEVPHYLEAVLFETLLADSGSALNRGVAPQLVGDLRRHPALRGPARGPEQAAAWEACSDDTRAAIRARTIERLARLMRLAISEGAFTYELDEHDDAHPAAALRGGPFVAPLQPAAVGASPHAPPQAPPGALSASPTYASDDEVSGYGPVEQEAAAALFDGPSVVVDPMAGEVLVAPPRPSEPKEDVAATGLRPMGPVDDGANMMGDAVALEPRPQAAARGPVRAAAPIAIPTSSTAATAASRPHAQVQQSKPGGNKFDEDESDTSSVSTARFSGSVGSSSSDE